MFKGQIAVSGFTLAEMMVGVALAGLVAFGVAGVMRLQVVDSSASQFQRTRILMMNNLREEVGDLNVLSLSLNQPENAAFFNCVCGTSCTGGGQPQTFSLYEPGNVPPQTDFKYFNVEGIPCQATDPNCLIQVQTQFLAQCTPTMPSASPIGPVGCTAANPAEFVGVYFSIQKNPNAVGNTFAITQSVAFTQVTDLKGFCP